MRLHTFAATLAFMGLSGSILFAGGNHAKICKRKARPYSLTLQALRGKTTTDLEIAVSAAAGWERPTWAKHVYLKGSLRHKYAWKRTLHAAALEDGRIAVSEPAAVRGASVNAEVRVRTCTCGSDQAMKKSTKVLFRPDLEIAKVHAPAQVRANQPVNVEIVVHESKGDLGATFGASLIENGAILDEVAGAAVSPAGSTSLVFTLAFDEPGTHSIMAKVGNSQPGDYDEANNVTAFQIDVLPATEAVPYTLYYGETRISETSYFTTDNSAVTRTDTKSTEHLRYSQSMPRALTWPLQEVSIGLWVDGENRIARQITGVQPTAVWQGIGSTWNTAAVYCPEEMTWVYVSSLTAPYGSNSNLVVQRQVEGEVWTSVSYRRTWGMTLGFGFRRKSKNSTTYTYQSKESGPFLHAQQGLTTHMRVTDADGRMYGGWASSPAIQHGYWTTGAKQVEGWWTSGHGITVAK